MDTYKIFNDRAGQPASVLRNGNTSIPFDPANTDYAEYLKWLDAGNTPLLAEGNAPIGADMPLPAETPDAN
jgi:hypothetical protein